MDEPAAHRTPIGAIVLRFVTVVGTLAFLGGLLFLGAGRMDWGRAWVYLGISALMLVVNGVVLLRSNPEVVAERSRVHRGTKRFDKVFTLLYIPPFLALPVVAGLDAVRFGWSGMGLPVAGVGALLLVLGNVPILSAMVVNRHLEGTVRIQEDRGHQVVRTGPYRVVRHPMYVGMILQNIAAPLLLGSAWAFVPAVLMIGLMVWRTHLEDRTLHAELEGYADFARSTRYRLLPGVW